MRIASLFRAIVLSLVVLTVQEVAATDIPIEFRDGMIRVKVTAAGQPLTFLCDSGAGATVIDLSAARRLKLQLGRSESVQGVHSRAVAYRVDDVVATIGSTAIPRSMLAIDLSAISGAAGCRVDGLLGADFFRGRIVQIDYAAERLRLLAAHEVATAGAESLPMASRNGVWCVCVGVGGRKADWMRVDTGCSSALEWVAGRAAASKGDSTSIGVAGGGANSVHDDVHLGSIQIRGVKIGVHRQQIFPGEGGLLGNGLLSRFTVTMDVAKNRLVLAAR
ncbi:MAG: hypothetical protein QOE70_1704 [Chthoniobacter sp.]|nr:hypothetical protein [Chthoniobacter sp.]